MLKKDIPKIYPITHIDFMPILSKLKYLVLLKISYQPGAVGLNFEQRLLEIDIQDMETLGAAVNTLKQLKVGGVSGG